MMLPNLLEMALSVLPKVRFEYRTYKGKTLDEKGIAHSTFSEWKTVWGMAQPVEATKYQDLGLDFGKHYYNFWASINVHGIDYQDVPDQIRLRGRTYNVERDTNWREYNGWHAITAYEDFREANDGRHVGTSPKVTDPGAQSEVIKPSQEQERLTPVADWS